ncbi:MAG: hypothetical protein HYR71_01285 [Chloroflexi bacterium]|nr:hypothetical protein [Chloroflexota bacterium]
MPPRSIRGFGSLTCPAEACSPKTPPRYDARNMSYNIFATHNPELRNRRRA